MKKIMAVYDVDSRYADRFAEFANQREQVPFKVVAFTSLEKLREFSKREQKKVRRWCTSTRPRTVSCGK